jgi:hypothetical protein
MRKGAFHSNEFILGTTFPPRLFDQLNSRYVWFVTCDTLISVPFTVHVYIWQTYKMMGITFKGKYHEWKLQEFITYNICHKWSLLFRFQSVVQFLYDSVKRSAYSSHTKRSAYSSHHGSYMI